MASVEPSPPEADRNEDTEMHDSDPISKMSNGDILINDLRNALQNHFSFTKSFAYASKLSAPNPCLSIEGAGLIGLPLSERDAKSIIECSTAPHGNDQEALIDKQVRDTWEINAQKVSFQNKAWEPFIDGAVQTVCHGLGIQVARVLPRCELSKLLLYEPGSHFLPHPDPQKPGGTFATMMIILPSTYTGGQVHVSHGTQSKVFDFSEDSATSTSVLSWYTDVVHEVKPVTSGYRLALSYNLIHMSTAIPKPILSDLDTSFDKLREVLEKWKKDEYVSVPKESFVIYLLDHEYRKDELLASPMSLKGADAHKISTLRPMADELGFTVCLGNLIYNQYGHAKDDEDGDNESADDISMDEVTHSITEIICLVDLNGNELLEHRLSVSNDSLIPENPFHNVKPNKKEYDYDSGDLEILYTRTVLVLVRNEDALGVFCSSRRGGFKYGLRRLRESDSTCLTQEDKEIAYAVIKNLGSKLNDGAYHCSVIASNAKIMVDYAIKWNDSEMWSLVMQHTGVEILSNLGVDKYFEGCQKFPFRKIENGLISTIQKIPELKNRLDFIDAIRAYVGKIEVIPADRYKEQLVQALSTFEMQYKWGKSYLEEIELLLRIAHTWSLGLVHENALVPWSKQVQKGIIFDTTGFWILLVQSLVKEKASLCAPNKDVIQADPNGWPKLSTESEFDAVVKHCLKAIVPQWDLIAKLKFSCTGGPYLKMSYYDKNQTDKTKVDNFVQILNIGFSTSGCLELCANLLDASIPLVQHPAEIPLQFKKLYIPLIPKVVDLLKGHNLTITSAPFDTFSRNIIGVYLHHVLWTDLKEKPVNDGKIGCGCSDCHLLDAFLANPNQQEISFLRSAAARGHLQNRLQPKYSQYCSTQTTPRKGDMRTLRITKKDNFSERPLPLSPKAAALAFLHSFGNDALLQVLMGSRWNDVLATLEGTRQFELDPMAVPPALPAVISAQSPQGHQVQQQAAASSTTSTQVMDQPLQDVIAKTDALEKKRKRTPEVIDPRKK